MSAVARELNSSGVAQQLDQRGYAHLGALLTVEECLQIRELYTDDSRFRSRIVMQRHGFGKGEYSYFDYPLPGRIKNLRTSLYSALAPIANSWHDRLGTGHSFPETHEAMLKRCHADGQTRPTPLILKYGHGDYNCLHQDLYGEHVFPIQVVILLSGTGDFTGGEFVLTEQRPRMQSRVEVVPLETGHGVAFAVNERPKQGLRGYYRVKMRHGVSEIRDGERYTLGLIFHDAT